MGAVSQSSIDRQEVVDEYTPLHISRDTDTAHKSLSYESIQQSSSSSEVDRDSISREDTERALSPRPDSADDRRETLTNVVSIISILLLGEFIANADTTLVYAAAGKISSEFDHLQDANWLSTAYTMGVSVAQPMYGKLCDIYGRKALLLVSYSFFAIGCVVSAVGNELWHVILGRAISGVGGAGTATVAAVIIPDLVPKRDIAAWRSYINIAMTLGRSLGGPTGGWQADTIGWRWMFLIQAILFCLAALLVTVKLSIKNPHHDEQVQDTPDSSRSKLGRIDFLGIICLAISISAGILLLDLGGQKFPWLSPYTILLSVTTIISFIAFIVVEAYIAPEPVFSLRIIRQPNVAASYLVIGLQIMAQVSLMFCIPLYFQVTAHASATVAGAHLAPAVVGNAVGGLLTGTIIKRTGRYKAIIVSAGLIASMTYTLLFFRWQGHNTNFWESLYIIPAGFGTGIAGAGVFVSMTSMLEPNHVAMATSGFLFCINLGVTGGVTASNALLGIEFKKQLEKNLHGPGAQKIIKRATSDVHYISNLSGHLREIVIACYVSGLKQSYILSLCCSLLSSAVALLIKDHQL